MPSIKQLFEQKGITQQMLISDLEVTQPYASALLNGKKSIGKKMAEKLHTLYGLDQAQLLSPDSIDVQKSVTRDPQISSNRGVPYYDIDFKGGFDLIFNDQTIKPDFYIDFKPFNDADGWVNVTGKSMGPLIAHGDLVALKKQEDWDKFLLEGEIYAIVTSNGFRTIKILSSGKDNEHYTLRSYNKGEEYSPQQIPKSMITHVFRVMGCIKKFF